MKDENILYWLWLSEKCRVGTGDFRALAEKFENPFDVYRFESEEIEHIEGIRESLKNRLADKALETAYSTLKYCKDNNVDIISYRDVRYPARLKEIENPPVLLYVQGKLPDFDSKLCLGVVGTRKMSDYGKLQAYKLSFEIASADVVIVSGMARGVDAVSAIGAMESGGATVAVLGCGIARTYPKEHVKLRRAILRAGGAIISEYPPYEAPNRPNFPNRNRIISGLCNGVVVIEGPEGSGALITASRAVSQGRELFAIPGNLDSENAEGPNELIRNGANVVIESGDIINHYDFLYHDVINYREYAKAKRNFSFSDKILKKYGIGAEYFKKIASEHDNISEQEEVFELPRANESKIEKKAVKEENFVPGEKRSEEEISAVIASLDETSREVFEKMPIGEALSPDKIVIANAGIGEVITSLTILEISGLISSLPGGRYVRNK